MPFETQRPALSAYTPPDNEAATDVPAKVTFLDIAAPVLEGWRTVAVAMGIAGVVVAGLSLFQHRKFEADLRLAAINTQRLPGNLSGLASLAGLAPQQMGLNASPMLINELLTSNSVLRSVGSEIVTLPGGGHARIVDRIVEKDSGVVRSWRIERTMSEAIRISISDKTGLITLGVRAVDSALARHVAERLVDRTRELFVATARAQAAELKRAQIARVDSAQRQLRSAEERLVAFHAANRVIAPYSQLSVQQSQLDEAVEVARQVYTQAVADREQAVAKELEETPAMVVVDPVPADMLPLPLYRVSKTLAVAFVVGIFASIWLVVRDGLRQLPPSRRAKIERVRRALGTLPLIGRGFRHAG